MERDDDQPGARAQPPRGGLEKSIEPVELAIDPDAERLKRARRRIDARYPRVRNGAADDRGEPAGRVDRRLAPRVDDARGRCGARSALRRRRKIVSASSCFARCAATRSAAVVAGRAIHPHVERLVALEAESAARFVELHRRDAEIGERAVDERDAAAVEHVVERRGSRRGPARRDRPRRDSVARAQRQRVAIAIEADEPRRARFEQRARVAAEAHRTIDEDAAAFRTQLPQHFGGQDRDVRASNPELRQRARVVVGVRLALQLGEEAIVVPDVEVVVLARARRRRRSSWRRRAGGRESARGPGCRARRPEPK